MLTVAIAAATLLAATARATWLGDLLVNFRVQYAAVTLLLAVALAWRRRPAWTVLALFACGVNGSAAWPWVMAELPPPSVPSAVAAAPGSSVAGSRVSIRLAAVNLFFLNRDAASVHAMLRAERPDVAVFVEVTPRWRDALEPLRAEYPYRWLAPAGGYGTLLVSKLPLLDAQVRDGASGGTPGKAPIVVATVHAGAQSLDLVAVHATWPMTPRLAARRNAQFRTIAEIARSSANPVVVLGDFNVSPFSPHFAELLRDGRLHSAAEGRGWLPTWPTFAPFFGLQLDHALVSAGVHVDAVHCGARTGSDHRPLVVDLALEPRASLSSRNRTSRGPV